MIDIDRLKALAEAANECSPDWYTPDDMKNIFSWADADFIAAANPAAVMELIADVKRGQRMLVAACLSLGDIGEALGAEMDDDADHLIAMIKDIKTENESLRKQVARLKSENQSLLEDPGSAL